MRATLLIVASLIAGCYTPDYQSGHLQCSPAGECPSGFHCVAARCFSEGDEPDLSSVVGGVDGADGIADGGIETLKSNGAACTDGKECKTGFCVDSVCCNVACSGQCHACDVTPGTCTQVASGQPHGNRPQCAGVGTKCGGQCGNSPTACDYPGSATSCRSQSCNSSTKTLAASCDGAGACAPVQTTSCGAFLCNAAGDDCRTTCSGSGTGECLSPAVCIGNVCKGQLANGATCGGNGECVSGYCFDSVCCNTSCTGQCEACNITLGTCTQVTGAPRTPRAACTGTGTGCAGTCGSSRTMCDYPTTSCRAASCSSGMETLAASCVNGTCPAAQTNACNGYICGATACKRSCGGDGDCASGYYCSGGSCAPKKGQGDSCNGGNECSNGLCYDNRCCDRACTGSCEQCDGATPGTCSPVGAGNGPRHGSCTTDANGPQCNGRCDGSSTGCTYPPSGTACGSCTGNAIRAQANKGSCNGFGTCTGIAGTACGNYACNPNTLTCYTSCCSNSNCFPLWTCTRTFCALGGPTGTCQ